ncbi:hypothetical protein EDC04DRAFT_2581977, partial [Pisolithus marmoratus]
ILAYIESTTLVHHALSIHELELVGGTSVTSHVVLRSGRFLGELGRDCATIIGPSLIPVLANLTRRNRTDIINFLELASRIAAKEVESEDHTAAY